MTRTYIGLGANLGDPIATIRAAVREIAALGTLVAVSALYRTPAWGVTEQPAFVNGAVALDTPLEPYPLLHALQALERKLGRIESFRWGPRAIDLDILTFGERRIDDAALTVPHPRLAERAFALVPLAEIAPEFATLRDALAPDEIAAVERIAPSEREERAR